MIEANAISDISAERESLDSTPDTQKCEPEPEPEPASLPPWGSAPGSTGMYDAATMSSTVERKMPTEIEQLRDLFRGQQNVKASDMITCCWNASSETCSLPGCVESVNPTAWASRRVGA